MYVCVGVWVCGSGLLGGWVDASVLCVCECVCVCVYWGRGFRLPSSNEVWSANTAAYTRTHAHTRTHFLQFQDYTTICNSAPSEILALIALRAKDKVVARNMEIVKKNLAALNGVCMCVCVSE